MIRTRGLTLLLISAALATVVACGGGSSKATTPAAGTPGQSTPPGGAGGQTAAAKQTGQPAGTPGASGSATGTAAAGGVGSPVAGASSPAPPPPPDITVLPDGTATNPRGTPVALPTAQAAGSAVAAPTAQATTAGVSSGAVISIVAPPGASGDFTVEVKLDGVTKPYLAFNIYVTFDPAILTAIVIKAGPALAPTPDEMFCVRSPATAGAAGLGCTVLQSSSAATNGVLATIKFHQTGAGTTLLHLRSVAEGAATTGTYIATLQPGAPPRPDVVTLIDGSVTLP